MTSDGILGSEADTVDGGRRLRREAVVWVAGHRGLVGSAVWRTLKAEGFHRLVGKGSGELDLRDRAAVRSFVREVEPDVVVVAAARVGGIQANLSQPVTFLSDNLQIQVNVLDAALEAGVERLLFLGSSCVYPRLAKQPIGEGSLLKGPLEPTNEAYAVAKIAGIVQVQAVRRQYGLPWISAMPTNVYGPHDNFSPANSHVLAALVARYERARLMGEQSVVNWGTGRPRREFIHADDVARACLHLLEHYDGEEPINVGHGKDVSIADLARIVADAVGYEGETHWDHEHPDGMPRKLLDVSRLHRMGWRPTVGLTRGVSDTVKWYREHHLVRSTQDGEE